jgi:acyl-CoA reductase-like NAD-dependent aldehyde dehydrogenase
MASSEATADTQLLINGEERPAAESFPVHDPHDGSIIGRAAAASAEQAADAVAAAQRAWPAWAALSATERARRALAALEGLEGDADERARTLSRENGKVLFEAQIDAGVFVGRFHQAAGFARSLDELEHIDGPPFRTSIAHVPRGVVTIIFPFNWPLAILAASLPYALMAGNTVVVKPPPTTPLSSVATLRHVALALPPGVLNVVTGNDGVIGPVVVGDSRVKHVCFTGSVGGGRRIMEIAAANLTNVTLELGGNDPAIILDDADLDEPAFGRPLNTRRQRDFVVSLLDEARAAGTEVREFGEFTGCTNEAGNFMRGALVLDPEYKARIVTEEQFGPALPIIPYDDEDEAIAQANDTWSGLCSSVWSGDDDHATEVAARLRTGVAFFNNHNATAVDERAPFGGFNQSGVGRELGREGLLEFTETHVMSIPSS